MAKKKEFNILVEWSEEWHPFPYVFKLKYGNDLFLGRNFGNKKQAQQTVRVAKKLNPNIKVKWVEIVRYCLVARETKMAERRKHANV